MAEDHQGRGPASSNQPSNSHNSHYPGEEDRSRGVSYQQRPQMASGAVSLPSIQDRPGSYHPPSSRGWDSRGGGYGASPNSTNGYPPPNSAGHGPQSANYHPAGGNPHGAGQHSYLPPVQAHPQDRNYPGDPRTSPYYQAQRPVSYGGNAYDFAYRPDRGAPGAYPPDYARGAPGAAAMMQQSAPRQRTSIACKYCRRRKIRCSGYQNSPGGKCTNCIKMNQECVFQPVSSSSSTAFVPVSALQNGVPPGTQLFGAYGEPLAGPGGSAGGGSGYPAGSPQYDQALPSPTGSYGSFNDDRSDQGRRRPRHSEEDHGMRLPPPNNFPDDNHPRRSPSSNNSPGHLPPYQHLPPQSNSHPMYENRTPPPRGSPSGPPAGGAPTSSVMSLGNIMDTGSDIDKRMLGKLNRRT